MPSAKTLYTEDLSNITFNYLCENAPNYLCHFCNHNSLFTTQLLCIFLAQTLHTFYKSNPSKRKFSDFPLLALKFTNFLMSFFKQKVSFSSKFRSFFSLDLQTLLKAYWKHIRRNTVTEAHSQKHIRISNFIN